MRTTSHKEEKDHAYVIYEVMKCHNDLRDISYIPGCVGDDDKCQVDPPCAGRYERNRWLKNKRMAFRVLND